VAQGYHAISNAGAKSPDTYGFTYRMGKCTISGQSVSIDDSLEWWGEGNMRWITGQKGCVRRLHDMSFYPSRPRTMAEAAALPGNDPLQCKSISNAALQLLAEKRIKVLEQELGRAKMYQSMHEPADWQFADYKRDAASLQKKIQQERAKLVALSQGSSDEVAADKASADSTSDSNTSDKASSSE